MASRHTKEKGLELYRLRPQGASEPYLRPLLLCSLCSRVTGLLDLPSLGRVLAQGDLMNTVVGYWPNSLADFILVFA